MQLSNYSRNQSKYFTFRRKAENLLKCGGSGQKGKTEQDKEASDILSVFPRHIRPSTQIPHKENVCFFKRTRLTEEYANSKHWNSWDGRYS
jgi:hypothetical protein